MITVPVAAPRPGDDRPRRFEVVWTPGIQIVLEVKEFRGLLQVFNDEASEMVGSVVLEICRDKIKLALETFNAATHQWEFCPAGNYVVILAYDD